LTIHSNMCVHECARLAINCQVSQHTGQ
jgi:hypothetical protein